MIFCVALALCVAVLRVSAQDVQVPMRIDTGTNVEFTVTGPNLLAAGQDCFVVIEAFGESSGCLKPTLKVGGAVVSWSTDLALESFLAVNEPETVTVRASCSWACDDGGPPPPPVMVAASVTETVSFEVTGRENKMATFRIATTLSGPRHGAGGIAVDGTSELLVDASKDAVWTCDVLSVVSAGRVVFTPVMLNGFLQFTQVRAQTVKLDAGANVVVIFPTDFKPTHRQTMVVPLFAAKDLTAVPTSVSFKYRLDGFDAVAEHSLDTQMGVELLVTKFTFVDPNAPKTTPAPTTKKNNGTGGGGNGSMGEFPIVPVAAGAGGGVVLLVCIVVVACVAVKRAKRQARESPSVMKPLDNMHSARADPDNYLSAEHDVSAFDDNKSATPPPGKSTRASNYDVAPPASDFSTQYTSAPAASSAAASGRAHGNTITGGAMPLPPKVTDFQNSVYAAVPEALRKEEDPWEIDFNELQMGKVLGEGAYGTVSEAMYHGRKVAVKQLHQNMLKPKDIKDFKKEAKLMKSLTPHANVVQLIGVNTDENQPPLFIVTEYCGGGACDSYLKKYGHLLNQSQRVAMMVAACRGVMHLHEQSIIHRDLACRNFLLTTEGGLKVADFGMSRDTNEDGNQTKCDVGPLRYMAPESMAKKTYSVETDCWAFGVVMWEIESNAATPYGDMALTMVAIGVAKEGLRLQQPKGCPDELYGLMHQCWQHNPQDRPSFAEIDETLLSISPQ